ncbi:MAG TPA: hypothetical protein VHD56_10805 [Tepidisphaeraceae bacterium]|nr:hypothetical protein [Tepidisphaeraceae bacterium]
MKRMLVLTSVIMLMVCTGCGDSHEKLAAESISTMKELIATLDNVKDEASANSAKSTLKSLMDKMNSINLRQSKLPAPSEAEIKAMEAKYGKEMEELARKLQANMMRVTFDSKIAPILQSIEQDMKKSQ